MSVAVWWLGMHAATEPWPVRQHRRLISRASNLGLFQAPTGYLRSVDHPFLGEFVAHGICACLLLSVHDERDSRRSVLLLLSSKLGMVSVLLGRLTRSWGRISRAARSRGRRRGGCYEPDGLWRWWRVNPHPLARVRPGRPVPVLPVPWALFFRVVPMSTVAAYN